MLFSEHFGIRKGQSELDFVDIPIGEDIPLFVDPFAVSRRPDPWSIQCNNAIITFFTQLLELVRGGHRKEALSSLGYLREPNETHFGLSAGLPRGAGIGKLQASDLYDAFQKSSAVKTGFLQSLDDCELFIEGVGRDKISDLTRPISQNRTDGTRKFQHRF